MILALIALAWGLGVAGALSLARCFRLADEAAPHRPERKEAA